MKKNTNLDFSDTVFWDEVIKTFMAHNVAKELPEIMNEYLDTYKYLSPQERHFFLKLLATSDGRLNPIKVARIKEAFKSKIDGISDKTIPTQEKKKDLRYFNSLFNKRQRLENEMAEKGMTKNYDLMDRERFGLILKEARRLGIDDKNLHNLAVSMATLKVFPVREKGHGDKRLNSAITWRYPRVLKQKTDR